MAAETTFENPAYDPYDDPYDDDDDDGGNETTPFIPQTSTPYSHGGENIKMQTTHHEQSGLPETSYVKVPLLSDFMTPETEQAKIDLSIEYIKRRFPKVNLQKLGPIGISKKGTTEVVSFDSQGGETGIIRKDGKGLLKAFTDKFEKALGPRSEEIIAEDGDTIQEQRQRLAEAEKQQREAEKFAVEMEKEKLEMENLQRETDRTQARIDALQEQHGDNLSEAELRRLKRLKRNHQVEYENKKKEVAALEKQAKNKQKSAEKVSRERAKLDEIVKKRNLIEERLNSAKPLDDLNEREAELRQENADDQAIIDATDTSPSDRLAAEARVEERNEELARLQTQIAEREEAMPLRQRIKEIFKKHGVTLASILLAAGVTIGVVRGQIETHTLRRRFFAGFGSCAAITAL